MLHNHTFPHVSKIIQFTFIAHVFHSAVTNAKSKLCLACSFVWFRFATCNKGKKKDGCLFPLQTKLQS